MVLIIGLSGIFVMLSSLLLVAACMRSAQISQMEEIRLHANSYSESN
jgi:hypothetical protein